MYFRAALSLTRSGRTAKLVLVSISPACTSLEVSAIALISVSLLSPVSTQVKLDAVINHMLGVQILHKHFIESDVPEMAGVKAKELGWHV